MTPYPGSRIAAGPPGTRRTSTPKPFSSRRSTGWALSRRRPEKGRARGASSRRGLAARGARRFALELREQRAHLLLHLGHEELALGLVEAQLDLGLVLLALVQQ